MRPVTGAVVLGSGQRPGAVDACAARRRGLPVLRRRSGGEWCWSHRPICCGGRGGAPERSVVASRHRTLLRLARRAGGAPWAAADRRTGSPGPLRAGYVGIAGLLRRTRPRRGVRGGSEGDRPVPAAHRSGGAVPVWGAVALGSRGAGRPARDAGGTARGRSSAISPAAPQVWICPSTGFWTPSSAPCSCREQPLGVSPSAGVRPPRRECRRSASPLLVARLPC